VRRAALLLALLACAACDRTAAIGPATAPAPVLDDRLRTVTGEAIPVDRIVRVGGFAYSARISGRVPGLRDGGDGRTLRVVEDGVALGPAGALSSEVVALGGGRFNHETATRVLFSASDNSDPRRNRRSYRVEWDEPARVVPHRATRTLALGTTGVVVDAAPDRPVAPRRLVLENTDAEHAVRVWGHDAGAPDLTTTDAILASVVRPGMTDEQKALALWTEMVVSRHHDIAAAAGLEASDPVKLLGVYGFGFCNDVSHALASLLERAGLRARVVSWEQHTVVEVRLDGRWRMLDADLGRIYRTRSGELASVADVFARRATAAFTPAGELPIAGERFDVAYPRGANRSYGRAFGATAHQLRPVLAPGDVVVFDFAQGARFVDRFSHPRSTAWPIRYANGTLRRALPEAGADGCRTARIDWPYPIVGARIVARGLPDGAAPVARVRGGDAEAWHELRVERTAARATADAAVWLAHGPIRYGAELVLCGAGSAGWRGAVDARVDVTFQFAPRTLPRVGNGRSRSLWSVAEEVHGAPVGRAFAGIRLTQEWDEVDAAIDVAVPDGGTIVNLDPTFFVHDAGPSHATPLAQQLPAGRAAAAGDVVALLENGHGIGARVASAAAVAAAGRGAFAVDGARLVLSASDDSDPRSNGRLYSLVLAPAAALPPDDPPSPVAAPPIR
jgi:transglutaminase-like putative cysteine protease